VVEILVVEGVVDFNDILVDGICFFCCWLCACFCTVFLKVGEMTCVCVGDLYVLLVIVVVFVFVVDDDSGLVRV